MLWACGIAEVCSVVVSWSRDPKTAFVEDILVLIEAPSSAGDGRTDLARTGHSGRGAVIVESCLCLEFPADPSVAFGPDATFSSVSWPDVVSEIVRSVAAVEVHEIVLHCVEEFGDTVLRVP